MTDEYQIDNVTWAEKDGNGNIVVDPDVVSAGQLSRGNGNLVQDSRHWSALPYSPVENVSSTSSTSYSTVAQMNGGLLTNSQPDGVTLYGRFYARMSNNTSNETVFLRPKIEELDPNFAGVSIGELEISVTGTSDQTADSGWTQLTSLKSDALYSPFQIQMKVSAGTGSLSADRRAGMLLQWRQD